MELYHPGMPTARAGRDKALSAAQKFVSCGQAGGDDDRGFAIFDTHSGNTVVYGIPNEVKKSLKKATPPGRFDALFGLTYHLARYDFWMHDNEFYEPGGELEKAIKVLGKAWRDMLKLTDAELGIDAEFTRPGVEALLSQLADDLEGCEASSDYPLKWK